MTGHATTPQSVQQFFAEKPRFRGQLRPAFQFALAERYAGTRHEDCRFVHSIDLLRGDHVAGGFDLRGAEEDWLGKVNLWGKRVVELHPGSGWLSAHIAARADELVVLDGLAGSGRCVGEPGLDDPVRRGWWFVRHAIGFDAQVVYTDPGPPPDDLGRFHVALLAGPFAFGADPLALLRRAAMLGGDIVIVSGFLEPEPCFGPGTMLALGSVPMPDGGPGWVLPPAAAEHMLDEAGFLDQTLTLHTPPGLPAQACYTVVARRHGTRARSRPPSGQSLPAAASPPAPPPRPDATAPTDVPGEPLKRLPVRLDPDAPPAPVVPPFPPRDVRAAAIGTADVEAFSVTGEVAFGAMMAVLQRASVNIPELGHVLDAACGFGCVLRHWAVLSDMDLHATDADEAALAWCRANLPFAANAPGAPGGSLPYHSGQFGLVYAISVLGGSVALSQAHATELLRVLRPGGWLYAAAGSWIPSATPDVASSPAEHPLAPVLEQAGQGQLLRVDRTGLPLPPGGSVLLFQKS